MNNDRILPKREDIVDLAELMQAVTDCATADNTTIGTLYRSIGHLLLKNIRLLRIDEDIDQLLCFARSMACEMLSPTIQARHFGHSCWSADPREHCPPYAVKINGENRPSSEVREEERQVVAMVHLFAHHLMRDPDRVASARALLSHEEEHNLWTDNDLADRD